MSSSTTSSFIFQSIFDAALSDYATQTGIDLVTYPFVQTLQSCRDPGVILELLQERANQFHAYRDGNRKLINSIKPLVQVLNTLSGVIASAANMVPFQPTNVILGGIDVLLAAAVGVSASYDALVDLFECIESFLGRLRIYTEIPFSSSMFGIVTKIMVEVMSVLSLATKQIKEGRLKKFAKKLLGESEIEAVLQRLDRLTHDEARMTGAETLQVIHGLVTNVKLVMDDGRASMDDLQQALVVLQETANEINQMKRDQLQEKVRNWLSPPDPSKNYNIAHGAHYDGTAEWFTQGSTFDEWERKGSLLWIHGKPGSGKSVLCSTIIEQVRMKCDLGLAQMGYYYFDFKDIAKQGIRGLLTSLIAQLSAKSDPCYQILSGLYSKNNAGSQQPNNHALTECLKKMLILPHQPIMYIIVDALDECPNTSGIPTPREEVLELLEELVGLNLGSLRICVTSRPEIDIWNVLKPLTSLQVSLHDEIGQQKDILDYISKVVHSDRKMGRWRSEDKQLVIDTLSAKADGMFRWVYCQLETLRGCFPAVIRRTLEELPETLDETYERTLLGIEKKKQEFAHRLFQCLTVAIRPLQVNELAELLAIRFDPGKPPEYNVDWRLEDAQEAVLSACSSLIAVINVDGSPVVQFAHFSVKEFLTSDRLAKLTHNITISRYHIHPQVAHTILAQASLSILLYLGNRVDKSNIGNFPFAQYAARYWVEHGRFEDVSSSLKDAMERLFDLDEPSFATWIWIYDIDYPFRPHMLETRPTQPEAVPLYYAALCGFHDLVEHLVVAHPEDVNAIGGNYGAPVNGALVKRDVEIALLLLEHSADLNIVDAREQTPLCSASYNGRCDTVEFLLRRSANVNLQDPSGETALGVAAREGELEIVRILLHHGAAVDIPDNEGWTPLLAASRCGHLDIVRLLIETGAAVDIPNNEGWTPLLAASRCGHLDVVRLLIETGAAVDTPDNDSKTPLFAASRHGHLDIMRLLIETGAAVDTPDNDSKTPLFAASRHGHLDIVRLLIETGAAVDIPNNEGWTPLFAASRYGHHDVMRLLIETGAAVDTAENHGWTPLFAASRYGHLDIVRLLIQTGAAVDIPHNDGWTPLYVASLRGHLQIAQELLKHRASVNAQNLNLETPLHPASANGHLSIVQLLTQYHADVEKRNKDQQTPLYLALRFGQFETARFLLECGPSTDSQDGNGSTLLHIAAHNEHLNMVKPLQESGADVNVQSGGDGILPRLSSAGGNRENNGYLAEYPGVGIPSSDEIRQDESDAGMLSLGTVEDTNTSTHDGMTSLLTAFAEGNFDVVQSLLDRGADVTERDRIHRTPLHVASMEGKVEVADLLIKHNSDINCRDKIGWTPLHLASRFGHLDVTHLLLDHGADVDAVEQDLLTPLHISSGNNYVEIARLLFERGANVHMRDFEGRTASMLASRRGERDLAHLLLG